MLSTVDQKDETKSTAENQTPNISSLTTTEQNIPFVRQNTVTTVNLAGVNIVALRIDGKERLCLAQISTTLLKRYSYNEIHNRRVALGITCVQCTPVQLEILRRAGAMPISSRRCGMITKREAERLVKSFLEENSPPKLPENFYFEVEHKCGWGCAGQFVPSRYNSSRAKCIKCTYCSMYFSPNKFIFHYHRMPDSKYTHPDAANFNSWRRHVVLSGDPGDDLSHAWEDVKAMFNGGSRKRVLGAAISGHSSDQPKKLKLSVDKKPETDTMPTQYNYPIFNHMKTAYPISPMPAQSAYVAYQYGKTFGALEQKPGFSTWGVDGPGFNTYHEFLWQNVGQKPAHIGVMHSPKFGFEAENDFHRNHESNERLFSPRSEVGALSSVSARAHLPYTMVRPSYISAFTPVGRLTTTPSSTPLVSPRSDTSHEQIGAEDLSVEENTVNENENIEIDVISDCADETIPPQTNLERQTPIQANFAEEENIESTEYITDEATSDKIETAPDSDSPILRDSEPYTEPSISHTSEMECHSRSPVKDNDYSQARSERPFSTLSKDELVNLLEKELQKSKEFDKEFSVLRETLQQQVRRELSYREQLAKQLQIVKENLYHELEQERKTRCTLQQKLKETHDALDNFSSKMLASRDCSKCAFKTLQLQEEISTHIKSHSLKL